MKRSNLINNKIYFRHDGNITIGMGHISRSLSLSYYLNTHYNYNSVFFSKSLNGFNLLKPYQNIEIIPDCLTPKQEADFIYTHTVFNKNSAVICDLNINFVDKYIDFYNYFINRDVCLVQFDNCGKTRNLPDLTINSLIHLPYEVEVQNTKNILEGLNYYILPENFYNNLDSLRSVDKKNKGKNLLLSFGGSDVANQTVRIVEILKKLTFNFNCTVVVGPFMKISCEELKQIIGLDKRFSFIYNPDNMWKLIFDNDFVITHMGLTVYEAAAMGKTSVIINPGEFHNLVAEEYTKLGASINLGYCKKISDKNIFNFFSKLNLSEEYKKIVCYGKKGSTLINKNGSILVCNLITDLIDSKGL